MFDFDEATTFISEFYSISENETDDESFLLLNNKDIRDLIKLAGPRSKFMKNLKDYLQSVCLISFHGNKLKTPVQTLKENLYCHEECSMINFKIVKR